MRKGFTLIEIMVVIVIMGILAAVAVPKLFGNVAKAKVSEISVAAGAYIKLQDVFLAEKTALGNWSAIGYVAPGNGKTNNFCYNQGTMTENTTAVEQQGESLIGWAASNVATLNDCKAGGWWSLVINVQGSNDAAYSHNVSSNECSALVNGWVLGTTMSGSCESTSVNQVAATPQPAPQETPKEEPKDEPVAENPEPEPEPQPEQQPEEEKPEQPVEEKTNTEPEKTEEQIQKENAAITTIRDLYNAYKDSKNKLGTCGLGVTSSSKTCHENRTAFYNAVINARKEFGEAFINGILTGDLKGAFDEAMDGEAK